MMKPQTLALLGLGGLAVYLILRNLREGGVSIEEPFTERQATLRRASPRGSATFETGTFDSGDYGMTLPAGTILNVNR